jgi:adenosylhomocysteine nucleosidase
MLENIVDSHFSEYDVLAFDMESAAFLHVCYLYNIPCLVIRTISDIIGSTTPLDYNNFSTIASNKVGTICKKLIDIM